MHENMSQTAAVFAKAASTYITTTNLGGHVQVKHDRIDWTIVIPPRERARIEWTDTRGIVEQTTIHATPHQDRKLRAQWTASANKDKRRDQAVMREMRGAQ